MRLRTAVRVSGETEGGVADWARAAGRARAVGRERPRVSREMDRRRIAERYHGRCGDVSGVGWVGVGGMLRGGRDGIQYRG